MVCIFTGRGLSFSQLLRSYRMNIDMEAKENVPGTHLAVASVAWGRVRLGFFERL